MEPAGLAVGVVGLVGLFSTCLDTIKRADAYRDFGSDSQALAARFDADKLRFEQWGRAVGIEKGILQQLHHHALDNQQMRNIIAQLITAVQQVWCDEKDATSQHPSLVNTEGDHKVLRFSIQGRPDRDGMSESKWKKVSWALHGKERRISQVEKLGVLVQKLYDLVPVNADADNSIQPPMVSPSSSLKETSILETEHWISELRRTLERVDEELYADSRRQLFAWIGDEDPGSSLYHDCNDNRVPGTGEWIMERPEFQAWLASEAPSQGPAKTTSQILWVNGPAGFGKTVMCARVAQYLSENLSTPVAHFFLSSNFANREDPYAVIRSWIKQLISQDQNGFAAIQRKRQTRYEQLASREDIIDCFEELVEIIPSCTFILDGLDECTWLGHSQHSQYNSVFGFLKTFIETISQSSSRAMIVSRDEPEIRNALLGSENILCKEYRIKVEDVQLDVASYAKTVVNQRLPNKADEIKELVSQKMAAKCEGQFLWVKMQAPSLRKGMNKLKLQQTVAQTPAGLSKIYERNWNAILTDPSRSKERAISLLRWAAFALRPLTVDEITKAALLRIDRVGIPRDELPDEIDDDFIESEILDQCGPLLEIRKASLDQPAESRTVHIPHFSVKEFLIPILSESSSLHFDSAIQQSYEKQQNTALAICCLQFISLKDVWSLAQGDAGPDVRPAFRDYAALWWYDHLKFGFEDNPKVLEILSRFFLESDDIWNSWRDFYDSAWKTTIGAKDSRTRNSPTGPLWYASNFGLRHIVELLLRKPGISVDAVGAHGSSPLLASIQCRHMATSKLLLNAGANVCTTDYQNWTPIHLASRQGHTELVRDLLDRGADVTKQNVFGWTCLHEAAFFGHPDIVTYLLAAGAEVNITTVDGRAPLYLAAAGGHLEVVKLLLEERPLSSLNLAGEGALFGAATKGHLEILRILLEEGMNPNAREDGWTVLLAALSKSHQETAMLLLDYGADPTISTYDGRTTLHEAASNNCLEITMLLLERELDPNAKSNTGWTPVHLATSYGHIEILNALLDFGGDVSIKMPDEATAFHLACLSGKVELVRLLLKNPKINPEGLDHMHRTGLFWASRCGHAKVVKVLVSDPRVATDHQDRYGLTPLYVAVRNTHVDVVEILLAKCNNFLQWKDRGGRSLMWWAAFMNSPLIIQLLVEHGAPLESIPCQERESMSLRTVDYDPELAWCDVCAVCVPSGAEAYKCRLCYGGSFCMCSECFKTGATCLDDFHTLALYTPI
ncbi:unnamed protein product [Clonostachys rosea]|uniref:Prion-inhibition and propagation HeLo domain-containing protein n=1 Tax=Bionectria ochroleuca TaxID=29856 RepID=A0ABY6U8C0_BIOOC|nr:unnamed protein product [Clonostachys rosea]